MCFVTHAAFTNAAPQMLVCLLLSLDYVVSIISINPFSSACPFHGPGGGGGPLEPVQKLYKILIHETAVINEPCKLWHVSPALKPNIAVLLLIKLIY